MNMFEPIRTEEEAETMWLSLPEAIRGDWPWCDVHVDDLELAVAEPEALDAKSNFVLEMLLVYQSRKHIAEAEDEIRFASSTLEHLRDATGTPANAVREDKLATIAEARDEVTRLRKNLPIVLSGDIDHANGTMKLNRIYRPE
jgi:hypothetical protein